MPVWYGVNSTMTPIQEKIFNREITLAHHDFEKKLNMFAFYKLHDKEIGEDLVQETFLKTWSYLVKGGKIILMKAFLYHILNDLIVDNYRKHKTVSLNTLFEKGFEPNAGDNDRLFNVIDGKALIVLISCLPENYRKVMLMKYVRLLSLEEISLITGQTRNSIAVQIHRGLAKLKLLYNQPRIHNGCILHSK